MFGTERKRSRNKKQREKVAYLLLLRQGLVGLLLFIVLGGVIYGVWYVTRLQSLTIDTVEVRGGDTVPHDEVKAAAEEALQGTYYKLIPKRFTFTYPEQEMRKRVESISKVKSAQVEKLDNSSIQVTFDEYQPYALWCHFAEDSDCLFIASDGYAFTEAPLLNGTTFIRFWSVGKDPNLGMSPFSAEFLAFVNSLDRLLANQLTLNVLSVEKVGNDEAALQLAGGGDLKITLRQSPEETLENLAAVLAADEFSHLTTQGFQYIDLRFGNKVFVNEEIAVATSTASTTDVTVDDGAQTGAVE